VDRVVKRRGTETVAKAYLDFLYTPEGQTIAAKNFYRPRLAEVAEKFKSQFPEISLVTIDGAFGGWKNAQQIHFAEGGVFDQISSGRR
jgi:sulfate transport system substrate-binding protein